MKSGTENLIKFKALKAELDLSLFEVRGILDTLWFVTRENCPEGDIGRFTDDWIAQALEWRRSARALVGALLVHRWLDSDDTYRLIVHDWPDHCEDSVHMKLARRKVWFANGSVPRTNRLPLRDREPAEEYYTTHKHEPCARTVRVIPPEYAHKACAQNVSTERVTSHALPCHAMPCHAYTTSNTAVADVDGMCVPVEKRRKDKSDPLSACPQIAGNWDVLEQALTAAHPKVAPTKPGSPAWFSGRKTLAQLVALDKFTETEVVGALWWLLTSEHDDAIFWRKNVMSFAPLRGKTKTHATKFTMIYERWVNSGSKSKSRVESNDAAVERMLDSGISL